MHVNVMDGDENKLIWSYGTMESPKGGKEILTHGALYSRNIDPQIHKSIIEALEVALKQAKGQLSLCMH